MEYWSSREIECNDDDVFEECVWSNVYGWNKKCVSRKEN